MEQSKEIGSKQGQPSSSSRQYIPRCPEGIGKLIETASNLLGFIRSNGDALERSASKHEDSPFDDLKLHAEQLQTDARLFEELLTPLYNRASGSGYLLDEHADRNLGAAFDKIETTISEGIFSSLIDDVEGKKALNWSYPALLYGNVLLWRRWEQMREAMLGPGKSGQVREKGPLWNLNTEARAALINIPDGSIQVAVAKVMDPRFTASGFWRMFKGRKAKCDGTKVAPLCRVDPKLKSKLGYRCKNCG